MGKPGGYPLPQCEGWGWDLQGAHPALLNKMESIQGRCPLLTEAYTQAHTPHTDTYKGKKDEKIRIDTCEEKVAGKPESSHK